MRQKVSINFKTKNMKLLTNEQQKSYQNWEIYNICKEKFEDKTIIKNIKLVELNIKIASAFLNTKT